LKPKPLKTSPHRRWNNAIRVGVDDEEMLFLKTAAAERDLPIAQIVREWLRAGREAIVQSSKAA
jgi:hypothetical protein